MTIRGPAELYTFLKNAHLINLTPETSRMITCLDEYARMCACDPPAARTGKFNQCKELYINFCVKAVAYKAHMLQKTSEQAISLYNGNQYLVTLSR